MSPKSCEVNGKIRNFICKIEANGRGDITENKSTVDSISEEFKIKAQFIYQDSKTLATL